PRGGRPLPHPPPRPAPPPRGRRLPPRLRRGGGVGGGGRRGAPAGHRQAGAAALRAGAGPHGAHRRGVRDGRRQRGLGRTRGAAGRHDGDPVRAAGRPRRRRALHGEVDGPAAPPARRQVSRVLLHSGGPLGPEGRREIVTFLGPARRVGFIPAANLHDEAAYFARVHGALRPPSPEGAGLDLVHIRWNARPLRALAGVDAVFMGGGNTYALLMRLRRSGLLAAIRRRVRAGMPYVGASAGSNVAGPTILTTNDWNVVGLARFDALRLVGFNINPHYKETDPTMAAG